MCTFKPHSVKEGCIQLRDITWLEQPKLALASGALRLPFAIRAGDPFGRTPYNASGD